MAQEIKPCPFCGSSDCEVVDGIHYNDWVVRCNSCGANGAAFAYGQDAVEKWNDVSSASVWQPIEAAPKDGSRILLFYSKSRKEGVTETAVGRWEIQKYHDRPRPYWENEKYIGDVSYKRENPPTHWMPLPSPPSP